jgi:hypothetical protein
MVEDIDQVAGSHLVKFLSAIGFTAHFPELTELLKKNFNDSASS